MSLKVKERDELKAVLFKHLQGSDRGISLDAAGLLIQLNEKQEPINPVHN